MLAAVERQRLPRPRSYIRVWNPCAAELSTELLLHEKVEVLS